MSRRSEDDKENLSKRQARKEEMRRRERQQRYLVIGFLLVIALIVLAFVITPLVTAALNPGGDFARVTPQAAYANAQGKTLGDPNAKVKIEVFEDFKCTACKSYADRVEPEVLKQIVDKGGVYYAFYNFPFLDDQAADKQSDRAANASECAAEQNRFWDYKALLFANQGQEAVSTFSPDRLTAFAKSLGLDTKNFSACLEESRYQSTIDESLALGDKMGVTGTPTVYVNGKDVTPGRVPTIEEIQKAVQDALAAP